MTNMNQQTSFIKKFPTGRPDSSWSERVLRRRRAVVYSDSTDTEVSPRPPPDSLLPMTPSKAASASLLPSSQQALGRKSNSCQQCRNSASSIKKRSDSSMVAQEKEGERTIDSLQMQKLADKLSNAELIYVTQNDHIDQAQEKLRRANRLLEAYIFYCRSLDLQARALSRLTKLFGNFAYKDLTPSETLVNCLDNISWNVNVFEKISDVQNVATSSSEDSEQWYLLLTEFKSKRSDYRTAKNTFGQYLKGVQRLSNNTLRKFEIQYDAIQGDYEYSRQAMEKELTKLIGEKHDALEHCIGKLASVQEYLIGQDRQVSIISKEVAKSLKEPGKQPCRQSCHGKASRQN